MSKRCPECGDEMVLMCFGFAGSGYECLRGPWGSGEHDSREMRLHRIAPIVADALFFVAVLLLFVVLVFAR